MAKISFLFVIVCAGMMSACAAQKSDVRRNGSCSELAVSTFKSVFKHANRYSQQGRAEDLVAVHNSCVGFYTALENGSCKVKGPKNKVQTVSYEQLEQICDLSTVEIRKQLDQLQKDESNEAP